MTSATLDMSILSPELVQNANKSASDIEQEFWRVVAAQVLIVSFTILTPLTTLYWPISGYVAACAFTIIEGIYLFYLHFGKEAPNDTQPVQMDPIVEDDTGSDNGSNLLIPPQGEYEIELDTKDVIDGEMPPRSLSTSPISMTHIDTDDSDGEESVIV